MILDGETYITILEAKVLVEQGRRHDNEVRPQSSLGHWPPAPVAQPEAVPGAPFGIVV